MTLTLKKGVLALMAMALMAVPAMAETVTPARRTSRSWSAFMRRSAGR